MTAAADIRARAARFYVERLHWRVLPLYEMRPDGRCACGRDCGKDGGKHPRTWHGVADASADSTQVIVWWEHWPQANIAIATGQASGLIVLDVDPRNGGDESLFELQQRHGKLPETAIVNTGGGGTHFYFRHPGQGEVKNCAALGGLAGLDLKADGGYVIGPPSNHQSGGTYEWDVMFHLLDKPPAACPTFLLELADVRKDAPHAEYEAADWNGELPPRVAQLLIYSPRVRARYRRCVEGLADASTSGVDFGLACQLALCGMTGEEIDHTLRRSRKLAGLDFKHENYIPCTVQKALGWAEEQRRVE